MSEKSSYDFLNDQYCYKIVLALLLNREEETRYTDLYRTVRRDLSKPTLSLHLKHLKDNEVISKRVDDNRNVFYRFNRKIIERQKGFSETLNKNIKFFDETSKGFFSLTVEEQVQNLIRFSIIKTIEIFEANLSLKLEPTFENKLKQMLASDPHFFYYDEEVFRKCVKDTKYREEVLQSMDNLLKGLESVQTNESGKEKGETA
jgi:DNA-binding transcriptional ArsR family regulator